MSRPWMPLYVADYLADTGHLSAAEHGAYLLLIMHYWSSGALPDDDRKLARIARLSDREWKSARPTIVEFFSDGWRHERIEAELAEANAAYERRAAAGRKGGKAKRKVEQCSSNDPALPKQSQPQPDSERDKSLSERVRSPVAKLKMEIAGIYAPGIPPDTGRVDVWIAQGYSIDIIRGAVLPVLRQHKPSTLKYCDRPLEEAATKRAPAMAPDADPADALVFVEKDSDAFERANAILEAQGEKPRKAIPSKYQGLGAWFPPAVAEQAKGATA